MPLDGDGLPHGHVGGEVAGAGADLVEALALAAHVEEEAGEVEDLGAAGEAVQLHQRHLEHRVAARGLPQSRTEDGAQMRDDPQGDVQQLLLLGAAREGHGGLDQVAVAVQLVVPGEVRVPLLGAVAERVDAVEIAVLELRGGDEIRDLAGHGAQLGIVLASQLEGHGLEPLVHVGVLEDHPGRLARLGPGDEAEVAQRAGGLQLRMAGAEPVETVALLAGVPEAAGDPGAAGVEGAQRHGRVGGGHGGRGQGGQGGAGGGHGAGPHCELRCGKCGKRVSVPIMARSSRPDNPCPLTACPVDGSRRPQEVT